MPVRANRLRTSSDSYPWSTRTSAPAVVRARPGTNQVLPDGARLVLVHMNTTWQSRYAPDSPPLGFPFFAAIGGAVQLTFRPVTTLRRETHAIAREKARSRDCLSPEQLALKRKPRFRRSRRTQSYPPNLVLANQIFRQIRASSRIYRSAGEAVPRSASDQ